MILVLARIYLEEKTIKKCLTLRANILQKIRTFFASRDVLEVETPLLLPITNPAPYLKSFNCHNQYLQTSPEFAMKRLLAAGSGDIYQICKAFRQEELGRLHNPEFTLLEWYRINFDHHHLMDEVEELLRYSIDAPQAKRHTYQEICEQFLHLNPHQTNLQELKTCAKKNNIAITNIQADCDTWLQLLFSHVIEPQLGTQHPTFIYDFPASQAMLAKVRHEQYPIASRFELYYQRIELANGFHELNNQNEQQQRFEDDLTKRRTFNLPPLALDQKFISSLQHLPDCAGVALGIDRLLLLAAHTQSLDSVLCFREW